LTACVQWNFQWQDLVADVVCEEKPFLDGFAHEGFLDGANNILAKIKNQLKATLHNHLGYNLLGGQDLKSNFLYRVVTIANLCNIVIHGFFGMDIFKRGFNSVALLLRVNGTDRLIRSAHEWYGWISLG